MCASVSTNDVQTVIALKSRCPFDVKHVQLYGELNFYVYGYLYARNMYVLVINGKFRVYSLRLIYY